MFVSERKKQGEVCACAFLFSSLAFCRATQLANEKRAYLLSLRAGGSIAAAAAEEADRRLLPWGSKDGLRLRSPASPSTPPPASTRPFPCASRRRSASRDLARFRQAMASAVRPSFLSSIARW